MKKIIKLQFLLIFFLLAASCGKDDEAPPQLIAPDISSFSPTTGPVGTEILITGKNFGANVAANTVKIGESAATISSASATELSVTVPDGAITGKISVTVNGETDTAGTFTVTEEVIGVILNENQLKLYPYPNYAETLTVTSDIGSNTVTWTSSDETVATVDQNGLVTPLKLGSTKIIASIGGDNEAECAVDVVDGPVSKLELNQTELELFTDESETLTIDLEAEVENTSTPVWSSDNESVATVDQDGKIMAVSSGSANITVTVDNASTNCALTVNPNVYAAGRVDNGNDDYAVSWKNGTLSNLTNGSSNAQANAITVNGSDVYVVGYETEGDVRIAKIWKNGGFLYSLNSNNNENAVIYSIAVNETGIYTAGYEQIEGVDAAKVWRNDEVLYTLTDGSNFASANSVFLSDNNVYVVGTVRNGNGIDVATLWINGAPQEITEGTSNASAYSVFVSGTDAYIAGEEEVEGVNTAKVWINGQPQYTLTDGVNYGYATSITVKDNNIYVVGAQGDEIMVWENGILEDKLTNGKNSAIANSIQVIGEDIYVAGMERNENNIDVAKIWKNGVAQDLTDGTINSRAFSVFVK